MTRRRRRVLRAEDGVDGEDVEDVDDVEDVEDVEDGEDVEDVEDVEGVEDGVEEAAADNIDGWSRPSAFVIVDPFAIALSLLNSRRVNSSL